MIIPYARHSWRADDSDSAGNQLADIRDWADANGHEIREEFSDKLISGAERERDGLAAALQTAKRGDWLVVRDWSRLGRDTLFLLTLDEELRKRGITLFSLHEGRFSADDDPMLEFVTTIKAALAKMQRRVISMMTSRRMKQHQANGRRMSAQPPYGQRVSPGSAPSAKSVERGEPQPGGLVDDPEEQRAIARILQLRATTGPGGEQLGYRPIARILDREGYRCRGSKWRAQLVKDILLREQ